MSENDDARKVFLTCESATIVLLLYRSGMRIYTGYVIFVLFQVYESNAVCCILKALYKQFCVEPIHPSFVSDHTAASIPICIVSDHIEILLP